MKTVQTELLEIAYFDDGPPDGKPVLLLHGWPDDPYGMKPVADQLHALGYRTIIPFLRGFGPTRFRHKNTFRDGRTVAIAQDALDLLDALNIDKCLLVGHDWGARAAYALGGIAPERFIAFVTIGIQYTPHGMFEVSSFEQALMWWYQWFMLSETGAELIRRDPVGFARMQWQSWSPPGWFENVDFERTAKSFLNPDWPEVTLHSYRSRWIKTPVDGRYEHQQKKIEGTGKLLVPYITIVGDKDGADVVREVEDKKKYFAGGHELCVFDGVGHFPAREDPDRVAGMLAFYFDRQSDGSS